MLADHADLQAEPRLAAETAKALPAVLPRTHCSALRLANALAFVYGDFRRLHRMGLIACHYRAAEWRHKEVELAAHDLLQLLDRTSA
jgi:hypothetical protein